MVRIISALFLTALATCALAQEKLQLVDNPPERHIVVPGDTLWGISGKFLKDPWRWPDIWQLNKEQIRNPHRIYPGDIVVLDRSGDKPRLVVATSHNKLQPQVYSDSLRKEIPSIPSSVIEAFISRPLIIEESSFDTAPRILTGQEDRVFIGNGDIAYVNSIPDAQIIDWSVYRPGKPLKDPETNTILGYEAFDLGSARLLQPGTPATVRILTAREEIGRGERLTPAPKKDLVSYVPRAPEQKISARIMSIYGGMREGGKLSVIALNRGTRDGVEIGHVLTLNRNQSTDDFDENQKRIKTQLPPERYGVVFVFRTFERISYALVMESSRPVIVGDILNNP